MLDSFALALNWLSVSAVLFSIYYISNSWWLAGLSSSAVMIILLAWFIHNPKIHPKPEARNSLQVIKQEIKKLKQRYSALVPTAREALKKTSKSGEIRQSHELNG